MQHQNPSPPISVFCVAAPPDELLLARWETHLLPFQQAKHVVVWSERHILAGTDRLHEINDHLEQAQVVFLLLSADFFASQECLALMDRALQRQQESSVHILPLLVRPVAWQETPLASLECLPSNGVPVTSWDDPENALYTCVQEAMHLLGLPTNASPLSRTLTLEQRNRKRMLQRLHHSYDELMRQSLQGIPWLELGFTERPAAVYSVTTKLLRLFDQAEQPLPPGTSVLQAYDEAAYELLLLGEPGTGKSTLLVSLAQKLVERAEHNDVHPLPVIIPLSSWALKRPALEVWLAEQLTQIYDVPHKLSEQWVREEQLLLLLDGLDEMEEAARPDCIAAINTYHQEHLLLPLVVCSRKIEYEHAAAQQRLSLQRAVVVQPLTKEQVDAALRQAGEPLSALHRAINTNATLQELATTPLMLSTLMLTYHGISIQELFYKEAQLRQQIWADFVQRMIGRRGDVRRYPYYTTIVRLSWLAGQMRMHKQTIFFLEQLQQDWLPKRRKILYQWSVGLVVGLIAGLAVGPLSEPFLSLFFRQFVWLAIGLVVGPLIGALFGWLTVLSSTIEPTEALTWSGVELLRGLLFGWLLGQPFGLLVLFTHIPFTAVLAMAAICPLIGGLFGFFLGFSNKQLTEHLTFSPNEGIRRSVKHGLFLLLVVFFGWLLIDLLFDLLVGPVPRGQPIGLRIGLILGALFGLRVGLLFGLGAAVQHYTLRFWLWRTHTFPWRAVAFLEDATARILLRRIGGGYSFYHSLLLDYFADLHDSISSSTPTTQTSPS